jgi:hypothetical protein
MIEGRVLGFMMLGGFALAGNTPSIISGRSAPKLGDTVVACIQRVPVADKAAYERWINEVSAPAFRRAGERFASWKTARAAMRRFVPVTGPEDSVLTYVYLWERPDTPIPSESGRSKKRGYPAIFEDAGMPRDSNDAAVKTFRKLTKEAFCVQTVEAPVPAGR